MDSATSGKNWYATLSLSTAASEAEIATAVELLSRRAAALAVTAPERSRELRDLTRSIKQDLLSGPEARQRYDRALAQQAATTAAATTAAATQPQSPAVRPPVQGSGIARFLRTGWVCSSCGTSGMPSDRFCMKCGARITAPGQARSRADDQAKGAVVRCATCGAMVTPGHGFCTGCGANIPLQQF